MVERLFYNTHSQYFDSMKPFLNAVLMVAVMVTFLACGGQNTPDTDTLSSEEESQTSSSSVEITIRPVGNEMKYGAESITVDAATDITLILENIATSPVMSHNVVILKSNNDDDVNRIGFAAIAAGEANGYLPEDDAILTATPMAKPGETVRVSFTTPSEPGVYRFICTYPGHYALMQGELIVI